MANVTGRALRQLQAEFRRIVDHMEQMHPACEVRPSDAAAVLRPRANPDGSVTIDASPVVCRVPERATHRTPNLYVVFEGRLTISSLDSGELGTVSYSTNFGYFLIRGDGIVHALGGHYDYAEDPAHPRAHMQLASQVRLHDTARLQFPSISDTPLDEDTMSRVLHRVRTPTAQMDFLSFMLQVAADHLVGDPSQPVAAQLFSALRQSCAPVKGFNVIAPLSACDCQRAAHWYPA